MKDIKRIGIITFGIFVAIGLALMISGTTAEAAWMIVTGSSMVGSGLCPLILFIATKTD